MNTEEIDPDGVSHEKSESEFIKYISYKIVYARSPSTLLETRRSHRC